MKQISIVIPVYNEEFFILGLLKSISQIDYPKEDFEVNVVCDGCTDGTVSVVKDFPFVRLIELKNNVGRYAARKIGAEKSTYPHVLFVDARCVVDASILKAIDKSSKKIIIGRVLSEQQPGVFETFYNSVRRKVFWQYYSNPTRELELNQENFDALPKGTTVLYVEKNTLFQAFTELSHVEMGKDSSDDTKLIRAIIEHTSASLDPEVKITNFYRKSFMAGLSHLAIYNAMSFVDYYLDPAQKFFWLVIVIPLLAITGIITGMLFSPFSWVTKFGMLFSANMLITLFLAKTFREFYIILFMMPLCVSAFYFGILRSIFIKSIQALKNIAQK